MLASGRTSRYYIDCKLAFSFPEARRLMGELMFEAISGIDADAIGGLALGAYPVAIAVSDFAYTRKYPLRVFVARKDAKSHGLKKVLEGKIQKGDRVVIVDDVITTGESTIDAIKKSREAGLEVVKAIALIDRQEAGGRENIEACGVDFQAVFTLSDFLGLIREKEGQNTARPKE